MPAFRADRRCSLRNNEVGAEGAAPLAEALEHNTTLQCLGCVTVAAHHRAPAFLMCRGA